MYGLAELKLEFRMTTTEIECPVRGCAKTVVRPRKGDRLRSNQFSCRDCGIFISPSTFEYTEEGHNLLWTEQEDADLLNAVKASKAEVERLTRERSEDAVSWNVFRYFHRMGHLSEMLHHFDGKIDSADPEIVYWSYSPSSGTPWRPLLDARVTFGEASTLEEAAKGKRVSEPDLIFLTTKDLIFVEAKFGSGNDTSGRPNEVDRRVKNPKKYSTGADGWFDDVFVSDYATVIRDQKYELMRFWLLGSCMARSLERRFWLVNLVRKDREQQIEMAFGRHIEQTEDRRFVRWEWESLGPLLQVIGDEGANRLHEYMVQKTNGFCEFKRRGVASPIKAFSMDNCGDQ